MSEKPYKHALGKINLLEATNYANWKRECERILQAVMAWKIVVEEEEEPNNPVGYSAAAVAERAAYRDYAQRQAQAAAIIYGSCGATARAHIDETSDPAEMWRTLGARMDGANNTVGRMTLCRKFSSLRPTAGQPITTYFGQLLEIRNQLVGTAEAITDSAFKTHIFTTLPSMFAVTIEILQSRADITIDEVFDALKECEKNKAMVVVPDAVSEALYTQQGGRGGRGAHQGRGNYRGKGRFQKVWCDWCKTGTHTTDNCWSKGRKSNKRTREDQGSATAGCYHCGEEGHIKFDCPVRKKGNALRNSLQNAEYREDRLKLDDNPQ
jgi:hypothetical protein